MTTSVVVVSHRPTRWLATCLASVREEADEVVVVDNGSPDEKASHLAREHGASVVRLPRNAGFAGGANAGLTRVEGDVIGLLNDDAWAEPGWLKAAIGALGDPGVAAVASKILLANRYAEVRFDQVPFSVSGDPRPLGRRLTSATVAGADVLAGMLGGGIHPLEERGTERWRWTAGFGPVYVPLPEDADASELRVEQEPVAVLRVVDLLNGAGTYLSSDGYGGDIGFETPDDGQFGEPGERFGACGGAMVMRAEVIARIGHFPGSFFAYYEDTDWCWRAQLAGFSVRYEPSAVVRHVRWATSGGPGAPLAAFLTHRNRVLCLARNAPLGVVGRQVGPALFNAPPPGLARSLGRRLPAALLARLRLARLWRRSPQEVWARWAGVDDRWEETYSAIRTTPRDRRPRG